MLRAVVDTNVWVSALLNPNGHPALLLKALGKDEFIPVWSQPMLDELVEVLSRPRLVRKYKLEPEPVAQFVALVSEKSELVAAPGEVRLCRDPRDDVVLETAIIGGASCLVSRDDDIKRDEDLVREMELRGVKVLSVASFLTRFPSQPG